MNNHVLTCVRVLTWIALLLQASSVAMSQGALYPGSVAILENPGDTTPTQYIIPNVYRIHTVLDSPYTGQLTSAGRPFQHNQAVIDLPQTGYHSVTGVPRIITAAMVNAFYQQYYPSHTVLLSATLAFNCHGITTGRGRYIATGYSGIGRVIHDDYQLAGPPQSQYHFEQLPYSLGPRTHSYSVVYKPVDWNGVTIWVVDYTVEKFATGPVMKSWFTARWQVLYDATKRK